MVIVYCQECIFSIFIHLKSLNFFLLKTSEKNQRKLQAKSNKLKKNPEKNPMHIGQKLKFENFSLSWKVQESLNTDVIRLEYKPLFNLILSYYFYCYWLFYYRRSAGWNSIDKWSLGIPGGKKPKQLAHWLLYFIFFWQIVMYCKELKENIFKNGTWVSLSLKTVGKKITFKSKRIYLMVQGPWLFYDFSEKQKKSVVLT